MPKYIVHLAGFEYMDDVALQIERLGGRIIKRGRFSPYLVVELPKQTAPMVMALAGVEGISPAPQFRTMQVETPF